MDMVPNLNRKGVESRITLPGVGAGLVGWGVGRFLESEDGVAGGGVAHEEADVAGWIAVLAEGGGWPVAGGLLVALEPIEATGQGGVATGVPDSSMARTVRAVAMPSLAVGSGELS